MNTHPLTGAGYLFEGMWLITRSGLRRFVIMPLLINVLVFCVALYVGITQFATLMAHLHAQIPSWLQWFDWLLWPLFLVLLLVVVFYSFSVVANFVAAPFNSLLAEKVELFLTGQPLVNNIATNTWVAELLPTLGAELGKILYSLKWVVPFLLLLFVPVIGPILWFLYTAWMLAVEYAEYPMSNHGLTFIELRDRLRQRRGMSVSFGGAVALLGMVPVINFIVMPSAVAGATAMWVRELKPAANG
ncbi:sulfate transporter CysZ [Chromatium okenii]|uniref:sulfate transporter CysZ n=1 Tax=Chromatium okenii TaxID=61644 RepID=UPI0019076140|nr:sulfate transporter CysZ [Chromatium okenii]MBK1640676.1 sulfate transporter CysZ [Chromatium okenii]